MHDKKQNSDSGSSASKQAVVDRKGEVNYVKLESSSSENAQVQEPSGSGLPSGYYRQGYCSCCQVHYINLEKHLAGDQHKQISNLHRNRFSTSMLMERFLQDVHLYHPQNYHDIRPTYDDLPEVQVLSSPNEDNSCTPLHVPQATVSRKTLAECVSGSFNSKFKSRFKTFKQYFTNEDQQQSVSFNSSLATCQEALNKTVDTIPQTIHYSTLPLCSISHVTLNQRSFEHPHSVLCLGSDKKRDAKDRKCKHYPGTDTESPKKTLENVRSNLQGSYCHLTSGKTSEDTSILKSQGDKAFIFSNHVLPSDSSNVKYEEFVDLSHQKKKRFHLSKNGNSVDETIEAVIKKYCWKASPERIPVRDDESVFSINVPSVTGCTEESCLSFEWNIPLELKDDPSKVMMTNVDLHKEYNVSIDEEYTSKLNFALSVSPTKEIEAIKPECDQEVLPALPHIPPSFVGKTWSQIMYEDDLKIEALVKEFRKGKFHCYFEEERSTNTGTKRKHKNKHIEKNVNATDELNESRKINLLPLFEDDFCEDHLPHTYSLKSEQIVKPRVPKPCKRVWRQASRCQVVKVSHGTQTSIVNYPVVKRKILRSESQPGIFDIFCEEKTPEMKTRMCALKLPESYTKILTPVQPKTMIYVLSHPDLKLNTGRRSRNRCSTDSRDSIYYKYKQSPLKYYDPLTNRILKTPPRNSIRGKSSKALCVRKLFRCLTSDGNVDKIDPEQKESSTSKKSLSSCSMTSLNNESAKGKDFNSSKKGSRSSLNSDNMGSSNGKSRHPEKTYKQISISPYKAPSNKVKKSDQHNILIAKSKGKPLRPQKLIIKESSVRHSKLAESRISTRSKKNSHRTVNNLEKQTKGKSGSRKQPRKKSSSVLSKSSKPFVQAYQSNKNKVTRKSNQSTREDHKKRRPKSMKLTNTKQSLTKNHFDNKYQEKNNNSRSRNKNPQLYAQSTKHYLRSRHKVTNSSSGTRTFTNTLTRRNVR